ncbi:DUF6356 family protein [Glaciimonas soli]|uniref:Capsule biosynthesis protein n=1 Tax=Glaciimonas soli TaxID=2590999 RepID=A0A843YMI4_9BURK|nr:DUF6356 family protein [Glaciimonas soli]MQR00120.1 hypothetical protein [Glaciimonas soli]
MKTLLRPFTQHPASVDETYLQHMATSLSFALPLLIAALACLIHAVFPFLCTSTGSKTITRLYDRMVTNRCKTKHQNLTQKKNS